MKKKFCKGFLGPIGDDLPSLIPLVFALIVFFYSFTYAWNVFDQRTGIFNGSLAILELGSIMRGNSYIESHEKFLDNCANAGSIKTKFKAGLVSLSSNPLAEAGVHFNSGGKAFSDETLFFEENSERFLCGNTSEEIPKYYNVRLFPVALERNVDARFFVQPMLLVVITWE